MGSVPDIPGCESFPGTPLELDQGNTPCDRCLTRYYTTMRTTWQDHGELGWDSEIRRVPRTRGARSSALLVSEALPGWVGDTPRRCKTAVAGRRSPERALPESSAVLLAPRAGLRAASEASDSLSWNLSDHGFLRRVGSDAKTLSNRLRQSHGRLGSQEFGNPRRGCWTPSVPSAIASR